MENKKRSKPKEDFCQIGRLTLDKRPLLSLTVVEEMVKMNWKGNFYLIGTGPLKEQILEYIEQKKLSNTVHLFENVTDSIKNTILGKSAVLFHPSIREGFGLAIVEAAEFGVPSILIQGEDNKDTELGINPSLVASSSDPSELAKLVLKVINNQAKYSSECELWNRFKRPSMTSMVTVSKINGFIRRNIEEA
jgi:glycosyltransferase involved in cell wall biosynthesis